MSKNGHILKALPTPIFVENKPHQCCIVLCFCSYAQIMKENGLKTFSQNYLGGSQQLGGSLSYLLQRTRPGQPKQMEKCDFTQPYRTGPVRCQTRQNPLTQLLQSRRSLVLIPAAQPS